MNPRWREHRNRRVGHESRSLISCLALQGMVPVSRSVGPHGTQGMYIRKCRIGGNSWDVWFITETFVRIGIDGPLT